MKGKRLALSACFAALICVVTAWVLHVPLPAGGYLHPGDAVIYLCACLLPQPWAMAAAALGGSLADLLTAPVYAPWTLVIKALLVPGFTARQPRILCRRNLWALPLGGAITLAGYYAADRVILGTRPALAAWLPGNLVQVCLSAALFVLLGAALDRAKLKSRFFSL